jgi:hypothetical protein
MVVLSINEPGFSVIDLKLQPEVTTIGDRRPARNDRGGTVANFEQGI